MSHVITVEAIITIAVVVGASALAYAFTAGASTLTATYIESQRAESVKVKTAVKVVFAANSSETEVRVWVKNVGLTWMAGDLVARGDVFFGPSGNFTRIPHYEEGMAPPYWTYEIAEDLDGDGVWDPSETIVITIVLSEPLQPGEYYVKYVTYNGVSDCMWFSI